MISGKEKIKIKGDVAMRIINEKVIMGERDHREREEERERRKQADDYELHLHIRSNVYLENVSSLLFSHTLRKNIQKRSCDFFP